MVQFPNSVCDSCYLLYLRVIHHWFIQRIHCECCCLTAAVWQWWWTRQLRSFMGFYSGPSSLYCLFIHTSILSIPFYLKQKKMEFKWTIWNQALLTLSPRLFKGCSLTKPPASGLSGISWEMQSIGFIKSGNSDRFYFLGLQNHCWRWHEIKRCLLIGRKAMTKLDSVFTCRDVTFLTQVDIIKATVFPVVMYGCESWTIKRAKELMLSNCGAGKDSRESLGQKGDWTSQSWRKSTLNIHWKDWCWSSNTLAA